MSSSPTARSPPARWSRSAPSPRTPGGTPGEDPDGRHHDPGRRDPGIGRLVRLDPGDAASRRRARSPTPSSCPRRRCVALAEGGYALEVVTAAGDRDHTGGRPTLIAGRDRAVHRRLRAWSPATGVAARARGRGAVMSAALDEIENVAKYYDGSPPVRALDGVVAAHRRRRARRPSSGRRDRGSRRCCTSSARSTGRPTGTVQHRRGRRCRTLSDRQLSAVRSQLIGFVFQQFFLLDGLQRGGERRQRTAVQRRRARAERRRQATEALERVGLGAPHRAHPEPPERRRTSAGRDRPGHRQPAVDRARRRTDRQPRFQVGRRR